MSGPCPLVNLQRKLDYSTSRHIIKQMSLKTRRKHAQRTHPDPRRTLRSETTDATTMEVGRRTFVFINRHLV